MCRRIAASVYCKCTCPSHGASGDTVRAAKPSRVCLMSLSWSIQVWRKACACRSSIAQTLPPGHCTDIKGGALPDLQENLQQLQGLVPGLVINLDRMKASDWVRQPHQKGFFPFIHDLSSLYNTQGVMTTFVMPSRHVTSHKT